MRFLCVVQETAMLHRDVILQNELLLDLPGELSVVHIDDACQLEHLLRVEVRPEPLHDLVVEHQVAAVEHLLQHPQHYYY